MSYDKSREHLVPIAVIDIGSVVLGKEKSYVRDTYVARLEATRDYINNILNKYYQDIGIKKVVS